MCSGYWEFILLSRKSEKIWLKLMRKSSIVLVDKVTQNKRITPLGLKIKFDIIKMGEMVWIIYVWQKIL